MFNKKGKNMKKIYIFLLLVIGIVAGYFIFSKKMTKKKYLIGVIQCASNPALDTLRDSCVKKIEEIIGKDHVSFVIKNADASVINSTIIADQLVKNEEIDAFVTIGSSPTQAIHAIEKKRTVVFAGVSDPCVLGLVYEKSNVTGTIDAMDEDAITEMITSFCPEAKKIGVLRTAGELNAKECESLEKLFINRGIQFYHFTVSSESDILLAVENACRTVDAVLVPTDSIVASGITTVIARTNKYNIPLFVCFNEAAPLGALATRGVDYAMNGKQTALILLDILLNKKEPSAVSLVKAGSPHIFVNEKTAALLKLDIPKNLQKFSILV